MLRSRLRNQLNQKSKNVQIVNGTFFVRVYKKQSKQQPCEPLSLAFRLKSSTNLMFLKSKGVSNLTLVVPSAQHFFSGVVIHHGVVAILVCELYIGPPLF